jgi:uncharacterized protein
MTGVHPETYPCRRAHDGRHVQADQELMGRSDVLKSLKPESFADEKFGAITIKDILVELDKPGRDPRPDFKVARFNDGIEDIKDLQPGMLLEGTVSNVAQFGAFVDLGVHQDGLVHVSQLSNKFVTDAREVVKTGDIVKVKVVEVDLARQRIALTGAFLPTRADRSLAWNGRPRGSRRHEPACAPRRWRQGPRGRHPVSAAAKIPSAGHQSTLPVSDPATTLLAVILATGSDAE